MSPFRIRAHWLGNEACSFERLFHALAEYNKSILQYNHNNWTWKIWYLCGYWLTNRICLITHYCACECPCLDVLSIRHNPPAFIYYKAMDRHGWWAERPQTGVACMRNLQTNLKWAGCNKELLAPLHHLQFFSTLCMPKVIHVVVAMGGPQTQRHDAEAFYEHNNISSMALIKSCVPCMA
jgi:hypothetical protein